VLLKSGNQNLSRPPAERTQFFFIIINSTIYVTPEVMMIKKNGLYTQTYKADDYIIEINTK
jgi:hypothetical protein